MSFILKIDFMIWFNIISQLIPTTSSLCVICKISLSSLIDSVIQCTTYSMYSLCFCVIYFQIQFCIIFYHNFSVMFTDCNYPKFINFLLSLNASLFLYMFGNFYYQNYVKSRRSKQERPAQTESEGQAITANGKVKDKEC